MQLETLGALTQNLMFPGQYEDLDTEGAGVTLSHNWHRTYDPTLGRYLQSDPVGLAGGLNRYAYVGGNPMNWVDPTGELVPLIFVAGFAVSAGIDAYLQHKNTGCIKPSKVIFAGLLGAVPITRLRYVTEVRKVPKIAKNARDAYKKRQNLKKKYRFGLDKFWEKARPSKAFDEIADPLASSGKTNPLVNISVIGGGGAANAANLATSKCGC